MRELCWKPQLPGLGDCIYGVQWVLSRCMIREQGITAGHTVWITLRPQGTLPFVQNTESGDEFTVPPGQQQNLMYHWLASTSCQLMMGRIWAGIQTWVWIPALTTVGLTFCDSDSSSIYSSILCVRPSGRHGGPVVSRKRPSASPHEASPTRETRIESRFTNITLKLRGQHRVKNTVPGTKLVQSLIFLLASWI